MQEYSSNCWFFVKVFASFVCLFVLQLRVTFVHSDPKPDSIVFEAVACAVTTSHMTITCRSPPGVGSLHVWSVWIDGQGSYNPLSIPRVVAPATLAAIQTSYTIPKVRLAGVAWVCFV